MSAPVAPEGPLASLMLYESAHYTQPEILATAPMDAVRRAVLDRASRQIANAILEFATIVETMDDDDAPMGVGMMTRVRLAVGNREGTDSFLAEIDRAERRGMVEAAALVARLANRSRLGAFRDFRVAEALDEASRTIDKAARQ